MIRCRTRLGLAACLALVLPLPARAQHAAVVSNRAPQRVPAATAADRLVVDVARHRLRFAIDAGSLQAAQPELNFNGSSMGELELRVPPGWTVELELSNIGQVAHSVRVVRNGELPVDVGPSVIPGAESPAARQGLKPGGSHLITFRPERAGRYRITCAVPAHGFAGMWVFLTVDASLKRPEAVSHRTARRDTTSASGH